MLWFTVWTVLVVGTVVGGFFLGRRLFRSGRALMTELERAQEVAERLEARTAELADTVAAANPVDPVNLDDVERARAKRAAAAEVMAQRAARRAARREATFRRWQSFSR
ncbi:hypothetical protein OEB99_09870 [Actinotalea sp. M2MS4P-6]|uniref:hypothetical protein n=1 Tax=Actinotalea sp. M2MS4P-6 TaxID=2983762 RepID=UPI0021E3A43E|nr:hypothetical protein [Actinotalea sp. M2MS4P-6]MCV2394613.1 hypothetical protein [Actinotalea sp. M2MS4P-6]